MADAGLGSVAFVAVVVAAAVDVVVAAVAVADDTVVGSAADTIAAVDVVGVAVVAVVVVGNFDAEIDDTEELAVAAVDVAKAAVAVGTAALSCCVAGVAVVAVGACVGETVGPNKYLHGFQDQADRANDERPEQYFLHFPTDYDDEALHK